jgi:glyoxylate reductase
MAKKKVFVTYPVPGSGLAKLKKKFNVRVANPKDTISKKKLIEGVKWADAVLCLLTEKMTAEVMDVNPNLKVIANYAVGFDNIDLKAATERGIAACNTPWGSSEAVAEHAILLMLAAGKRLVETDQFVRAGKYKGWRPSLLLGEQFQGKTIGILGAGRIGQRVSYIAHMGIGMKVLYHDVKRNQQIELQGHAEYVSMKKLLEKSDVISVHVPLLPSTHHLIGAKEFKAMKKDAIFINTSRGPVVDEKALVTALKKGKIKAAGIDVYEHEPKMAPGLTKLDNVILTSHTASATMAAREAMSNIAADNIIAVLSGKMPPGLVNKDVPVKWKK